MITIHNTNDVKISTSTKVNTNWSLIMSYPAITIPSNSKQMLVRQLRHFAHFDEGFILVKNIVVGEWVIVEERLCGRLSVLSNEHFKTIWNGRGGDVLCDLGV